MQIEELMNLFRQVQINMTLVDDIKHLPTYAKFLKELCTPYKQSR